MGITRHIYLDGHTVNGKSKDIITFLASLPSNIYHFKELNKCQFLVKNEFNLKNGFTYNRKNIPNDYILISVWDKKEKQSIIKLISIKSGKIIYRWKVNICEINKEYNKFYTNGIKNDLSVISTRLYRSYIYNDGSLIFDAGGLYKIDKNSNFIWKKSSINRHHSIERSFDNSIWSCGYNLNKKYNIKYKLRDDCILKINEANGEILFSKSILEIFIQNNYNLGQLFFSAKNDKFNDYIDYFHLNDIQPVINNSKFWKKGDVFMSLRNQNMILLYRPSTNKILWTQVGPWLKQHDVDIIDSTRIGIFGNDVLDGNFNNRDDSFLNKTNHHYIYDFRNKKITRPYNSMFRKSVIKTSIEGRSKIITNKGIFIEETCRGRLLFGDEKGLIWTYVEKIDEENLSMFSWSRYITEEEFSKFTFLKNK